MKAATKTYAAGPGRAARTGGITQTTVERLADAFNASRNLKGGHIRVVLATDQFYEGVDLNALRYVHIADPFSDAHREIQAVGRGVRFCGHGGLAVPDRSVNIVRWFVAAPQRQTDARRLTKMMDDAAMAIAEERGGRGGRGGRGAGGAGGAGRGGRAAGRGGRGAGRGGRGAGRGGRGAGRGGGGRGRVAVNLLGTNGSSNRAANTETDLVVRGYTLFTNGTLHEEQMWNRALRDPVAVDVSNFERLLGKFATENSLSVSMRNRVDIFAGTRCDSPKLRGVSMSNIRQIQGRLSRLREQ